MREYVRAHWFVFGVGIAGVLALCFFAYYQLSRTSANHFRVVFFNIGQGDSALIRFNEGQKMLVDCGPDTTVLFRLGAELPVYERTLDYMVVTHTDLDHFGGCASVLERYRVGTVVVNGQDKSYDAAWRQFMAAVANEQARVVTLAGHDTWNIASSTLEFFSPDVTLGLPLADANPNNYSIVFKLTAPNSKTFLFSGDMEEPLENVILKKYCAAFMSSTEPHCPALQSSVLKVGHHGSNSGTSELFLRAVAPQVGIISVGARNTFGHPSPRTLRHLTRASTTILRTDQVGDIVIE